MQFYSPQQSNPKRREKCVTNFRILQKKVMTFCEIACVCGIVMLCLQYIKRFATVCCIVLSKFTTLCKNHEKET